MLEPSLPQIEFAVSGNSSYLNIDRAGFTPANTYQGDPINNQLGGITCSCVCIPQCWAGSYLGLYAYFEDEAFQI